MSIVLDEKSAARYLGLSDRSLQARRAAGQGPTFVRIGRSVRYLQSDLDDMLAASRVVPLAAQAESGAL